MLALKNKTILILSPQSWGTMYVAKHHYAIELAFRGNTVYFLNPPDNISWSIGTRRNRIKIKPGPVSTLFLISHKLYFPFLLKFHAKKVFHLLVRKQVKDILSMIDRPVDIVWSFDLGNLYPLSNFKTAYKIFHPVDEPRDLQALKAADHANIIFAVTQEILDKYREYSVPRYFINHGVSDYFFKHSNQTNGQDIRVGFSGNLLRPDIDHGILLKIIRENSKIIFEFWGNYESQNANLGDGGKTGHGFVRVLREMKNVILHGSVPSERLPEEFRRMNGFLICYDIERDQSKGTNYHKIMEYLSTGKVIISNNVTTYSNRPDLIQMISSRKNNEELPGLFANVIKNLSKHNSTDRQQTRINFARENLYSKQLLKIENLINATG